jgi:hypothetical protein
MSASASASPDGGVRGRLLPTAAPGCGRGDGVITPAAGAFALAAEEGNVVITPDAAAAATGAFALAPQAKSEGNCVIMPAAAAVTRAFALAARGKAEGNGVVIMPAAAAVTRAFALAARGKAEGNGVVIMPAAAAFALAAQGNAEGDAEDGARAEAATIGAGAWCLTTDCPRLGATTTTGAGGCATATSVDDGAIAGARAAVFLGANVSGRTASSGGAMAAG